MLKPNTKVQLLSLLLLEALAKNCGRHYHEELAESDLWSDVLKIAGGARPVRGGIYDSFFVCVFM